MNKEESSRERVKVGFVGVGDLGQCSHIRKYATLPACEVEVIAKPKSQAAELLARRNGAPRGYAAIFENRKLAAIVAAQRFQCHGMILPELLKIGKPLFIKKTLYRTLEPGKAILDVVKKSGTWGTVITSVATRLACMLKAMWKMFSLEKDGHTGDFPFTGVIDEVAHK